MVQLHIVEDITLDMNEWRSPIRPNQVYMGRVFSYLRGLRLVTSCRTLVVLDFGVYLHMLFILFRLLHYFIVVIAYFVDYTLIFLFNCHAIFTASYVIFFYCLSLTHLSRGYFGNNLSTSTG